MNLILENWNRSNPKLIQTGTVYILGQFRAAIVAATSPARCRLCHHFLFLKIQPRTKPWLPCLPWRPCIRIRGVNSYLKPGGRVVMWPLPGSTLFSANTWVGNCPLCPPAIYTPENKMFSMNLVLAYQSQSLIQNPAFWLVGQQYLWHRMY